VLTRHGNLVKQGSSSFLKKRTKKLLFPQVNAVLFLSDRGQGRRVKSFLLLFFKKEGLVFAWPACRKEARA
jgi:hypothetical protein